MNPQKFFGRKISKQGVNVTQATDNQLIFKEDFNAGNTTYYAANNSSIVYGVLGDGSLGQEIINSAGNVLFKMSGSTWSWYDTSGNVVMMVGYLPVAQIYGWAVAVPGQSLAGVV